jgi:hypothetical protein
MDEIVYFDKGAFATAIKKDDDLVELASDVSLDLDEAVTEIVEDEFSNQERKVERRSIKTFSSQILP